MNFISVWLLRRIFIVVSVFFLVDGAAIFQVILNIVNCIFYICYIMHFKPF